MKLINKDKAEYYLLKFLIVIVTLFGKRFINITAKSLAVLMYYLIPIRKETALNNLRIAFPDKQEKEIKQICFNNYYSFIYTLLEILLVQKMSKEELLSRVKFKNTGEIENRIKNQEGCVLLTAHFGNWELAAIALGALFNIQLNVIAKPQRNPYVSKLFNDIRELFGNKVIPLGISIRQVYSILKERKPLGVVGDQRGPKEGMRVKFFSQDTAVFHGSVELALKTNTPIFIAVFVRENNGGYTGEFVKLDYDNLPGDEITKIRSLMQSYMNILEEYVRKNPEQWFWMHKIWKY